MKPCLAALLAVLGLWGADEQELALAQRAQADFDRVALAPGPSLRDTATCIQSQAALLPAAPPAEVARVHFRKGYCALAGAAITHNAVAYQDAAAELERAGTVPLLVSIALLEANAGDSATLERARTAIVAALAQVDCRSSLMPAVVCEAALEAGREWLGWMDLGGGNLVAAAREFSATPALAWQQYVAGRQAWEDRRYREAASDYRRAMDAWDGRTTPTLFERLQPQPEISTVLADLAGSQLLAGDPRAAIVTLDRAVKADPSVARAYYLRACAKEAAGQAEAAMADYNLASRVAFASAQDRTSGEAHLYRGILLYRRGEFSRAEDEFSSALNFNVPPSIQADTTAWRYLAAVAAGACGQSRQALARALGVVSPFFPKPEATGRMDACAGE